MSHKLASDYAKWRHPFPEEEQRAVDAWLDEQHPERKQNPPGEATSLFDESPAAKTNTDGSLLLVITPPDVGLAAVDRQTRRAYISYYRGKLSPGP